VNEIKTNSIETRRGRYGQPVRVEIRATKVPGSVVEVELDTMIETAVSLPGTHPRGPVSKPQTDEDGITSINWSRVIAGTLHHFRRLVMPSGRVRFVVQRHNGYADLRSNHAWAYRHFFTFPAPGPAVEIRPTSTPGANVRVDLDTMTETAVVLPGTHPRGAVSEPVTLDSGVTATFWRRVIAGGLYHFSRITMPDGEVRYVAVRHNGHADLRLASAWTRCRFINVSAPAAPTVADLMIDAKRVSQDHAVALRMAAMHLLGLTGRALSDAVPTRGQREMLRAQVQVTSSHPAYVPLVDRAV